MSVIECANVAKRIGERTLVDGVSLRIDEGEIVGLLGPNGAGKTTLMKVILGLTRRSGGKVHVLGETVPLSTEALGRVGAVIEEPSFYRWMSGRRNLQVILDMGASMPPRSAEAALERVGLSGVGGKRVKAYSQGMRQRLGLAAALVRRPAVVVLDEPANGLDPQGIAELRQLLVELQSQGTTILLSSHQLLEVERVCDRVLLMNGGKIKAEKSPKQLDEAAVRFRITVDWESQARARDLLAPFARGVDGTGEFLVAPSMRREALALLAQNGIEVESMSTTQQPLEEWFIDLVEERQP